jgi:hypothetical protein
MARLITSMIQGGMKVYKFISYQDWLDNYQASYPNAIANVEKTEVILSCNDHSHGCITHDKALEYIKQNWKNEE